MDDPGIDADDEFETNGAQSSPPPITQEIPKARCLTITRHESGIADMFRSKADTESQICLRVMSSQGAFIPTRSDPKTIYIDKCPSSKNFNFFEPAERKKLSPWKGMNSYVCGELMVSGLAEKAKTDPFYWYLDNFLRNPKHLENAGIKIQFSITYHRELRLYFMMDKSRILDKIEDAEPVLFENFRNNTHFLLRLIILGGKAVRDLPRHHFTDEGKRLQEFDKFYTTQKQVQKDNAEHIPNYNLRLQSLACNLKSYQKDTVRWMIHRETFCDQNPIWNQSEEYKHFHFYPHLGVLTRNKFTWNPKEDFMKMFHVKGGIVADEMGLGKTVQVLSLINAHRKSDNGIVEIDVDEGPEDERLGYGKSAAEQMKIAEESYKELKSARSTKNQAVFTTTNISDPVTCTSCKLICSASVCGWKFPKQMQFVCPACTSTRDRKEIGTTLIILPESLIYQWFTEIARHCPECLKVLFYFGVRKHGYLQIHELEKYDVILTTFDTLTAEMMFLKARGAVRDLRQNSNQHFVISPLIHVKFWRVVIDESQLMPTTLTGKLAKMIINIEADNWWCISGTPLLKSINDIGSVFRFIDLYPFSNQEFWDNYVMPQYLHKPETSLLMETLARIMSRKTKQEVAEELQLPELEEVEVKVQFSAIEERQYENAKEIVKKKIANHIGNKEKNTLLMQLGCSEQVMSEINRLVEMVLTGESLRKQVGEVGGLNYVYAPETAIFKLVHDKKMQIMKYFREYAKAQTEISEVMQLEKELRESLAPCQLALERYQQVLEVETYIEETITTEKIRAVCGDPTEDVEDPAPPRRNFVRAGTPRYAPRDSGPRVKRARMNENVIDKEIAEEHEAIAKEEKEKMVYREKQAKIAFKKMKLDVLNEVHLKMNMRKVQDKLRDEDMVDLDELKELIKEYYEKEKCGLESMCIRIQNCKVRWNNNHFPQKISTFFEKWTDKIDEVYDKMNEVEFKSQPLYKDDGTMDQEFLKSFGQNLPFNPFFAPGGNTLPIRHFTTSCMGSCSKSHKSVESFAAANNKVLSIREILSNTTDHLEQLDHKRKMLERKFKRLLALLKEMCDPGMVHGVLNRMNRRELDGSQTAFLQIHICSHEVIRGPPAEREKVLKRSLHPNTRTDCQLCSVYTDICWLKFKAGFLNFHGGEPVKNGIVEYVKYLLAEIPVHVSEKMADNFMELTINAYFAMLQNFCRNHVTAVSVCLQLADRFNELQKAIVPINDCRILEKIKNNLAADDNSRTKFITVRTREAEFYWTKTSEFIGELRYFTNLLKDQLAKQESDATECTTCLKSLRSYLLYACGHRGCVGCHEHLKLICTCTRPPPEPHVHCPQCRKTVPSENVMIAKDGQTEKEMPIKGMVLSAKLTKAINLMKEIIEEDDTSKIILFTNVTPYNVAIWRYLQKILKMAELPFSVLSQRQGVGKEAVDFDMSQDKKILLCSLPMCSSGLNMTGANHIIFLDPPHLQSVLLQAIGRINRFGQKREMKVWHMLVEGSIDEWFRKSALKKDQLETEKNGWTCGDICTVFGISDGQPQVQVQAAEEPPEQQARIEIRVVAPAQARMQARIRAQEQAEDRAAAQAQALARVQAHIRAEQQAQAQAQAAAHARALAQVEAQVVARIRLGLPGLALAPPQLPPLPLPPPAPAPNRHPNLRRIIEYGRRHGIEIPHAADLHNSSDDEDRPAPGAAPRRRRALRRRDLLGRRDRTPPVQEAYRAALEARRAQPPGQDAPEAPEAPEAPPLPPAPQDAPGDAQDARRQFFEDRRGRRAPEAPRPPPPPPARQDAQAARRQAFVEMREIYRRARRSPEAPPHQIAPGDAPRPPPLPPARQDAPDAPIAPLALFLLPGAAPPAPRAHPPHQDAPGDAQDAHRQFFEDQRGRRAPEAPRPPPPPPARQDAQAARRQAFVEMREIYRRARRSPEAPPHQIAPGDAPRPPPLPPARQDAPDAPIAPLALFLLPGAAPPAPRAHPPHQDAPGDAQDAHRQFFEDQRGRRAPEAPRVPRPPPPSPARQNAPRAPEAPPPVMYFPPPPILLLGAALPAPRAPGAPARQEAPDAPPNAPIAVFLPPPPAPGAPPAARDVYRDALIAPPPPPPLPPVRQNAPEAPQVAPRAPEAHQVAPPAPRAPGARQNAPEVAPPARAIEVITLSDDDDVAPPPPAPRRAGRLHDDEVEVIRVDD